MSLKKKLKTEAHGAQFEDSFKCLKPEDTSVGIKYAFTYNLSDDWLPHESNLMNHSKIINFLDFVIDLMGQMEGSNMTLFPEFSRKARLHFHGVLVITDRVKFYLKDIPLLVAHGNIKLDTLDDPEMWDLYCRKNEDLMLDYFTQINIIHLSYYPLSTLAIKARVVRS